MEMSETKRCVDPLTYTSMNSLLTPHEVPCAVRRALQCAHGQARFFVDLYPFAGCRDCRSPEFPATPGSIPAKPNQATADPRQPKPSHSQKKRNGPRKPQALTTAPTLLFPDQPNQPINPTDQLSFEGYSSYLTLKWTVGFRSLAVAAPSCSSVPIDRLLFRIRYSSDSGLSLLTVGWDWFSIYRLGLVATLLYFFTPFRDI